MSTAAIMLQGTGSHVGKSLLVAGLCRAYANRGLLVKPFKPQNMSNNAAVTQTGEEIGRAQDLQARAARVATHTDMNPILLKPQSETGAQVIVNGKVLTTANARDYHQLKPKLLKPVLESYQRLCTNTDLVIIEGAGSPAEINLRVGDIANMGFALAEKIPVILIGDIERGGVIASLIGTYKLLEPEERQLLQGYIINKFRGDPSLFDDAIPIINKDLMVNCLGIVTHFNKATQLPAEDIMDLDKLAIKKPMKSNRTIRIVVPRLPRISNFDDLDPLNAEIDVDLQIIEPDSPLPGDAHLILLPGSKSTRSDLAFLKSQRWHIDIESHVRRGGQVLGLCGGYQMLGHSINDPYGIEGTKGISPGLGLLNVETVLSNNKRLQHINGTHIKSGTKVTGYEMHMGITNGPDTNRPMFRLHEGNDGAYSLDGKIGGSYLHGIFSEDSFRHNFLDTLMDRQPSDLIWNSNIEKTLDLLGEHLENCLNLDQILQIANAK